MKGEGTIELLGSMRSHDWGAIVNLQKPAQDVLNSQPSIRAGYKYLRTFARYHNVGEVVHFFMPFNLERCSEQTRRPPDNCS